MATTINTPDIRDKAVTSLKLEDNITIAGYIDVDIIKSSSSYITFLGASNEAKMIAASSLVVSQNYAADYVNVDINTSAYFEKNVIVKGDLIVSGTTTSINTAELNIADNIMYLNSDLAIDVAPTENAGIEINRGSLNNVSFKWDETSKFWTIDTPDVSDVISTSRLMDKTYSDNRYVNATGDTMVGNLTINGSGEVLNLGGTAVANANMHIYFGDPTYGFKFLYTGSEAAELNSFELWTNSPAARVWRIQQDGIVRFDKEAIFNSNITMAGTTTVDGVNISNHHSNSYTDIKHVTDTYLAGLAGTSGTPGATNKYVTNSDTRLTNDRTAIVHGDEKHNALSYFDFITDGVTSATASAANQKILLSSKEGLTMVLKNNTSGYDAEIEIGGDLLRKYTSDTPVAQSVNGDVTFNNNLTVDGNLTVNGTTTYVNTTQLNIGDNIITLNADLGPTGSPTEDSGIEINRGTLANKYFKWDEGNDMWEADTDFRINGGDLRLNNSVGTASFMIREGGSGNEIWNISDGTTSSSLKVSTIYDNDNQIELKYTPGSVGAITGVLNIGQLVKNNANFTHGETNLYTNGVGRLKIDNSGRVGIGSTPTEKLDVAGNIRTTGNIILNSATPEILFNGTSDAGVDMAIKATPEGLDFYEPEDSNKIQFQIFDDTGVNAPFGYQSGGVLVIDSSQNITAANISSSGTISANIVNITGLTTTASISATTVAASGTITSQTEIAAAADLKTTAGSVNIQDKVKIEWDEATQSLDFNFL